MRHHTEQGATLDELEQAGLVSQRERNDDTTYYRDFFRDRLIMPIRDPHDPSGQAILGFVGRRNPNKTDDDYAGPKYLNTRTTPVFTKGEALFGYAEARALLADYSGAYTKDRLHTLIARGQIRAEVSPANRYRLFVAETAPEVEA